MGLNLGLGGLTEFRFSRGRGEPLRKPGKRAIAIKISLIRTSVKLGEKRKMRVDR